MSGTGLRWIPVEHTGNQNESPEEVEVIYALVEELHKAGPTWTDRDGAIKPLTRADILVVAPYNAQVAALMERFRKAGLGEPRVGTVDKFQGQEGPLVIYSMTSSSRDDAPRGMDFLYSPNRLNVATSRAKCLAVVVGNPSLFAPECKSPKEMRLANAFSRLMEMAE